MKAFTNVVIFAFLVFGGFWIGMQWWSATKKPEKKIVSQPTVVDVVAPEPPQAPTVTEPVVVIEEPKKVEVQPAESLLTKNLPNEEVIRYENARFKYSFDISKKVYYSGFGAQWGASHTVGIDKAEMPDTFADASVKVYFYGNQILPELQNSPSTLYQDPEGKFILLLVGGKSSVKIESNDLQNPIVTRVVQSITVK